jgi:menaquinone-dependent protoporphyrinogen oxidase
MKVLVTAASRHGATGEIGEVIANVLRDAGFAVETRQPDGVGALDYDAIVLGSGVYAGHWLPAAKKLGERIATTFDGRRVWLFSSGPIGDPPMPVGEVADATALAERVGARGHASFAGRLDRPSLGFLERTITRAVGAADGDFRDWEAVRSWADEIVEALGSVAAA